MWQAVEGLLTVPTPKRTIIMNWRLGLLLMALRIAVLAGVVMLALDQKPWQKFYEVDVTNSWWFETPGSFDQTVEADLKAEHCDAARNAKYDYHYDEAGQYHYSGMKCEKLSKWERAKKEAGGLFYPTMFEEELVESVAVPCGGSCDALPACTTGWEHDAEACLCTCTETRDVFSAGISGLSVAFEHSATVVWPTGEQLFSPKDIGGECGEDGLCPSGRPCPASGVCPDLRTVIQSHDDQVETLPKGDDHVSLTLAKVLELAGLSMEDFYTETAENALLTSRPKCTGEEGEHLDGCVHAAPTLRQTGAKVKLHVGYYNAMDQQHGDVKSLMVTPHESELVIVKVSGEMKWNSRQIINYEKVRSRDGAVKYRSLYAYGVSIEFEHTGRMGTVDKFGAVMGATVFLVFMSYPGLIVTMLATYCLGPLSKMYKRAINTPFSDGDLLAGQLCRTMVRNRAFKQISADGELLTKQEITREIYDIFQDSKILDTAKEKEGLGHVLHALCGGAQDDSVERMEFLNCCTNSDVTELEDTVEAFDMDRRPGFLEMVFDAQRGRRAALLRGVHQERRTPRPTRHSRKGSPRVTRHSRGGMELSYSLTSLEAEGRFHKGPHNVV